MEIATVTVKCITRHLSGRPWYTASSEGATSVEEYQTSNPICQIHTYKQLTKTFASKRPAIENSGPFVITQKVELPTQLRMCLFGVYMP